MDGLEYSIQRHLVHLSDTCILCTLMETLPVHVQFAFLGWRVWLFEQMQQV